MDRLIEGLADGIFQADIHSADCFDYESFGLAPSAHASIHFHQTFSTTKGSLPNKNGTRISSRRGKPGEAFTYARQPGVDPEKNQGDVHPGHDGSSNSPRPLQRCRDDLRLHLGDLRRQPPYDSMKS